MTRRIFDDESRYLDRYGLLLVVTTIAVVTLSLIDLGPRDDLASALGQLTVSVFVGATLLIALQASGVRRRYQLIANIGIGVGILASLGWCSCKLWVTAMPPASAPPHSSGPCSRCSRPSS